MTNEYETYILREYKVNKMMIRDLEVYVNENSMAWSDGFFKGMIRVYENKIEMMEMDFPWLANIKESENILNS